MSAAAGEVDLVMAAAERAAAVAGSATAGLVAATVVAAGAGWALGWAAGLRSPEAQEHPIEGLARSASTAPTAGSLPSLSGAAHQAEASRLPAPPHPAGRSAQFTSRTSARTPKKISQASRRNDYSSVCARAQWAVFPLLLSFEGTHQVIRIAVHEGRPVEAPQRSR